MGLLLNLPDEGKHRLVVANADLPAIRRHQGPGAVAVILYHAENGDVYIKPPCHLQGGPGVGLAAVDEEHIRQGQELFIAVCCPLESPRQHLLHGGVVVGVALQGLDAEPAVGRFQGPHAAVHHHGSHDVALSGVGDVEGFHPLWRRR